MGVDEAGRRDQMGGFDDAVRRGHAEIAEADDAVGTHTDVCTHARRAGAVDDERIAD